MHGHYEMFWVVVRLVFKETPTLLLNQKHIFLQGFCLLLYKTVSLVWVNNFLQFIHETLIVFVYLLYIMYRCDYYSSPMLTALLTSLYSMSMLKEQEIEAMTVRPCSWWNINAWASCSSDVSAFLNLYGYYLFDKSWFQ